MTIGNRIGPPRFLLFLALLPVAFVANRTLLGVRDWADGAAMAFDLAALVFLVSLMPLLRSGDAPAVRDHAAENDANRVMVLVLTTLLTIAVMAAVAGALGDAKDHDPVAIAKLIATLLLIWLFANTVYALHYAHAFYARDPATGNDAGGLDFPGTVKPTYSDFAYFAFTLGMTFQTSDVQITSGGMRRIALLHSFGAFVFNIGVIAFAINVLGGA